jgi:peptidylprolyl isomerase
MNKKMILWFLIVILVVGALVFIIINKKNDPIFVDDTIKGEENMQNEEGVKVVIIKEGDGEVAKSGDTVAVNYTGKLVDGTVFDSNVDPKFSHVEPFAFTIDGGQVIRGWDVGVNGMKVGEKRILEIAPEFAYGDNGIGPIPPKSTLIFEVELLAINK